MDIGRMYAKKKKKSLICGQKYHGRCERKEECTNCGEEHNATDKGCRVYKLFEQMNKFKAEERITTYEARKKIQDTQWKRDKKQKEEESNEKEETEPVRRTEEELEGSMRRRREEEQDRTKGKWSDVVQGRNRRTTEEKKETIEKRNDSYKDKGNKNTEKEVKYVDSSSDEEWLGDVEEKIVRRIEKKMKEKIQKMTRKIMEIMDKRLEEQEKKMEKKLEEKFNEFFKRIDEKEGRRNERMEVITKQLESNDKMVQYVIDNNIGFNRIDADTKKKYKEGKFEWEKEAEKGDIEIQMEDSPDGH